MLRMALEPRVVDRLDRGMSLEELRDGQRVVVARATRSDRVRMPRKSSQASKARAASQ